MTSTPARMALDRSTRSFDQDGHLRVGRSVLTAVGISPYAGYEIPGADKLGLDPNRIYQMLRPADELKRAYPSLAGKPILLRHIPVSSSDHPHDDVVGAVGSDVAFDGAQVTSSLSFWTDAAIAGIQTGDHSALSCGYWFRPVMTPGRFNGVAYDGVMTSLAFNHLSLVFEPRVPGAMVGDSALQHVSTERSYMRTDDFIRQMQALDEAKAAVKPLAGDILAQDADSVYVRALAKLGHDVSGIRHLPGAAKALWPVLRNQRPRHDAKTIAADAAILKDAGIRFPGLNSLKVR